MMFNLQLFRLSPNFRHMTSVFLFSLPGDVAGVFVCVWGLRGGCGGVGGELPSVSASAIVVVASF